VDGDRFVADEVFPAVSISRQPIEYPRGNWGEPYRASWLATVKRRVRHARWLLARRIAGDQWPSDPGDWD